MKVETQQEADQLNESGAYGPYMAANGHLMMAELRWPREAIDQREWPAADYPFPPANVSTERDYRVGDEIRYTTWNAWCAPGCNHDSPPEDW